MTLAHDEAGDLVFLVDAWGPAQRTGPGRRRDALRLRRRATRHRRCQWPREVACPPSRETARAMLARVHALRGAQRRCASAFGDLDPSCARRAERSVGAVRSGPRGPAVYLILPAHRRVPS
jgi:hypothetical protein